MKTIILLIGLFVISCSSTRNSVNFKCPMWSIKINNMNVKIKKLHENAVIPKYAKDGDAGLDLVAVSRKFEGDQVVYGVGLAIEIPKGHVGLLFPRSSISKYDLALSNSVGVIDSGYRGEIMLKFNVSNEAHHFYSVGDKIGQLLIIPYPSINLVEVYELSDSIRGAGGFGSTGN